MVKKKVTRQARLDRLKEFILINPTYGRKKLAKELKKEYGVSFRLTTIAKVKEEVLLGEKIPYKKPTGKKSITGLLYEEIMSPQQAILVGFDEAYHKFVSAGFLKMEIRNIFSAGNVPELFSTKPFEAMLRERRAWVRDRIKAGLTKGQIIDSIKGFYSKRDITGGPVNSPFDFLRGVYLPPLRVDFKTYRELSRRRALKKTRKLYAG